ncbi:Protein of unknown function [Pyronema omphalodes CBS 100304]|uniref:Uncharacterized protein n=1 Tax=Pyronema omphalodes (strain CBS 100304) TaxID=1076935 RepID=U4LEP7_PYROM|nr:Protein of unknown function [Pyronema omphalodes CBS 100304]
MILGISGGLCYPISGNLSSQLLNPAWSALFANAKRSRRELEGEPRRSLMSQRSI